MKETVEILAAFYDGSPIQDWEYIILYFWSLNNFVSRRNIDKLKICISLRMLQFVISYDITHKKLYQVVKTVYKLIFWVFVPDEVEEWPRWLVFLIGLEVLGTEEKQFMS